MDNIINFLVKNYEWISGIGALAFGWFLKDRYSSINKVKQQNIIAGGDVIGRDKRRDNDSK